VATKERTGEAEVRAWLKERGVNVLPQVYDFPIDQIDERASRHNQARPTALVDEAVDRYVVALKNGAEFPPGVAYFPAGGTKKLGELLASGAKATLIDGNHREAAHKKAGKHTFPLLIIAPDTPSELITLLTVEANSRHGQAVDLDWRVRQAIHLYEGLGWPIETAAQAAVVSVGVVRQRMTVNRSEQRAKGLGIANYSKLSNGHKHKLSQIKDDAPFKAASKLVIQTGMPQADLAPVIAHLKGLFSEAERLTYIEKVADEQKIIAASRVSDSKASRVRSPKNILASGIGSLLSVEPDELAASILMVKEREEIKLRLEKVVDRILELQVAVLGALSDEG
jgi:hypothetical protein